MKKIFLVLALTPMVLFAQKGEITSQCADNNSAVVAISGLAKPLKVMHITDSHIVLDGPADEPFAEYAKRMSKAYTMVNHHSNGQKIAPSKAFIELMDRAITDSVDLITLTGDIINYPSPTAVEHVLGQVKRTGIPFIFVAGNHDWHYEGMPGTSDELREVWREKHLKPLYNGTNPSYSAEVIGGVNFVKIDNSTYQISAEQLLFYKSQKAKGLPIVLLMHIPIYTESYTEGMGDPRWGPEIDQYYIDERRPQWPNTGNRPETMAFIGEVVSTPSVVVLCGHTHSSNTSTKGGMVQYVTRASTNGSCRMVHIVPSN